ncbi:Haloalkane dehalogenase [Ananas comosus]|uniref:Haloalkane dehalogenase n=1 Tax=Ananas comosus TaxID=4615 RepID=A0A199UKK4_ANACO|nr:Haloalkane dehalogenase [Ananas comosus]
MAAGGSGAERHLGRQTGSVDNPRGTIVFIHGAPTQSYSYRVVMSQMAEIGYHCFAPDWIGFGFSDKPQPGYGFNYTEEEFHSALDKLLDVLNITCPFILVSQGFLVGSYGLTWALKNTNKILKLVILNSPLNISSPLPGLFQKLRIPLYGEFTCQNAVMAERFIEAELLFCGLRVSSAVRTEIFSYGIINPNPNPSPLFFPLLVLLRSCRRCRRRRASRRRSLFSSFFFSLSLSLFFGFVGGGDPSPFVSSRCRPRPPPTSPQDTGRPSPTLPRRHRALRSRRGQGEGSRPRAAVGSLSAAVVGLRCHRPSLGCAATGRRRRRWSQGGRQRCRRHPRATAAARDSALAAGLVGSAPVAPRRRCLPPSAKGLGRLPWVRRPSPSRSSPCCDP